jgi:predicted transcriptional regulator
MISMQDLCEIEAEIVGLILEFGWLDADEIVYMIDYNTETINEALEELFDDGLLKKCGFCNGRRICFNMGL